jgi:hypothetical protein
MNGSSCWRLSGSFKFLLSPHLLFLLELGFVLRMALDVKSRAKRYEKLDFLGEGQVRLGTAPRGP